jgi:hypothetical protein
VAVAVARGATETLAPSLESSDAARRRLFEGDCGCERGEAEADLGTT